MDNYAQSKERWRKWRDSHEKDPVVGYINWEHDFGNFKIECWNTIIDEKVQPVIYQFWIGGNGFNIYAQQD